MEENKQQPSYYAIIPANVRYANIPDKAKLLYGEITALCNQKGYCWATNEYFANLYGVHKKSISRLISILEKEKFIILNLKNKTGVSTKRRIGIHKIEEGGIHKIEEQNNTSINNTNNSNFLKKKPYFMNKRMSDDLKWVIFGKNDLREFAGDKKDIVYK
jgi:SOS-response transcriptional repressor LexA